MDRLNQLRNEASGSRDSTLDTSSPPSEAYLTANDSSKYFSLLEDETNFVITKDTDNPESEAAVSEESLISNLSPIPKKKTELGSYNIGEQIEAANILSGGVEIFDDNDNSYDGDHLIIDDNIAEVESGEDRLNSEQQQNIEQNTQETSSTNEDIVTPIVVDVGPARPSKDTEVLLQIDGKNVDAIDIGNGLYLYRRGEEDLAAVQILDNTKQHSNFKFLKVRENADGNLEVYEEIEVEVPAREGQSLDNMSIVPMNEANRVVNEPISIAGTSSQQIEAPASLVVVDSNIESQSETRAEVNLNGRMMKFNESRKSPVVGSYTPMTFHSTPNKEGIPLTKTMVNQQLHPSRHSDNVKKTIEVHTDQAKQRILETAVKARPDLLPDVTKTAEIGVIQKEQNEMTELISEELQKTEPDLAIVNQKDIKIEELGNEKRSVEVVIERSAGIQKTDGADIKEDNINKEIQMIINENKIENQEANGKTNDLVNQNEDNEFAQCIVIEKVDISENIEPVDNNEPMRNNSKDLQNDLAIASSALECKNGNISVEIELSSKESMDVTSNEIDPDINNKSETKLNEDKNVSIEDIPDVNKISKTHLTELDKDKEDNIGKNVLDVNNMDKTSLKKINEDENSCIESVTHIKEMSKVDLNKLNEDQNNSLENITSMNKISDTEQKISKNITDANVTNVNEMSVTLKDLKEDKNVSIGKVPDINKVTEANLRNLNEDNILGTENVIDVNKVCDAKTEDTTNTTAEVPEVNEISKLKVNERNKQTSINIISQQSSKTIVYCNSEGVETSNSINKGNENANLDQKNFKSYPENETFVALNITETVNIPTNVSIPKKEVNESTFSNVNNIFSEKENTSIDTTKPKSIHIQNARNHENSSSVKRLNTDKSLLTSGKQITASKDIPLSNKDVVNPGIDVKKHEELASKEKSAACQISSEITSNLKSDAKRDIPKVNKGSETKLAVNNNKAAVPFGKWTEANRQEFLNKIKETKVPSSSSNAQQIKQPNDLNRRDILQKIDSQRQQQTNNAMAKVQEQQKLNKKNEATAFVKSTARNDSKIPVKERSLSKPKATITKKITKDEPLPSHPSELPSTVPNSNALKKESTKRREINNQDLIDKTIEDIINRTPSAKPSNEELKQNVQNTEGIEKQKGMTLFGPSYHAKNEQSVTLDDIEMKMNELHGIPFVERPAHELPQSFVVDSKSQSKINDNQTNKGPNLLSSFKALQKQTSSEVLNLDSDDEIIEHEPITGDINHKLIAREVTEKLLEVENSEVKKSDRNEQAAKKDVIITEKDFDKFFRRNSVTYENCLTVNFDGKEPHNVIQTIVEKEVAPKKLSRNEVLLAESKAKSTHKQQLLQARHNHPTKMQNTMKYQTSEEDSYGKNYQSKLQIAYQSALTAKRQKESPITIIEDKPVKVVFMESNVDFLPGQLNVQGEKVSQTNKLTPDLETLTQSTTDSLDSDILDNFDTKSQDDGKTKSKHQRKQVLTPVDIPEIELIEPSDLGIETSPKKKRKLDDKMEKSPKNHVPKKSYLLGRTAADDKPKMPDMGKISFKEITNHNNSFGGQLNSISAIDNLVKAAELLENQADSNSSSVKTPDSDSQNSTPAKRGRGRPRKYPLPDGDADKVKVPSPQKKPRLIDAKVTKGEETTDEDDETSDDEIIRENWTMGKINENIVCPICGKLFRSENVVFKHVKHCTGPSPTRSESDKRRFRESQESETRSQTSKSDDMDIEEPEPKTPKKRKSKESISNVATTSDEVIVIEDTPLKEKPEKHHELRKSTAKTKIVVKPNNSLVCEICGKSFRQASYLAHHKLSHKNEELKRQESETNAVKSVFRCEVCKKEFRKLHHLVQHRIIHNSNAAPPSRILRKSSSEQGDSKMIREQSGRKPTEDLSAGFRCEPCDKSFRKLHHLVEHRETHDGINRQRASEVDSGKPTPIHQCDMCPKTFKKEQLLNEHRELHLDTCSEKSDDKSVKSSLSTKDIIHECSLCYMVFPNEHSLNKHTVICLRKKKQSAAKAKQAAENKELQKESADLENPKSEEYDPNDTDDSHIILHTNPEIIDTEEIKLEDDKTAMVQSLNPSTKRNTENATKELKDKKFPDPVKPVESVKKPFESKDPKEPVKTSAVNKNSNTPSQIPTRLKQDINDVTKSQNTPAVKKKIPAKEKVAATVTKRQKTVNVPLPVIDDVKATESSDDDEIRYMLNPNFREEDTTENNFMKVQATKRNSLQIERPNSRDLVKRRISLQHPPKISRLKNKLMEQKSNSLGTSASKAMGSIIEKPETDPAPSSDSDDSDVKYSFPVTLNENSVDEVKAVKKPQKRKSLAAKRKSLTGVAKRKSLGKLTVSVIHKVNNAPPAKQVKKRTTEVEHRCDCGRLFSSAALLSRHTTLDHTPPRIRRRRSPEPAPKLGARGARARPSTHGPEPKVGIATRKASNDPKAPVGPKVDVAPLKRPPVGPKGRRSAAQKAPVPEKVRKLAGKP